VGLGENNTAARAAQGFVGSGGGNVGNLHRVRVQASGNEASDVGHIHHQVGAHLVSDIAEALPIQHLRVVRETRHDHLGLVLQRQTLDLLVVHQAGFRVKAVLHGIVDFAGEVDLGTVGQVTAVGQAHAQHRIARITQGGVDRSIGLGAGVRLDVGVVGTKELLGALDSQGFALVNI